MINKCFEELSSESYSDFHPYPDKIDSGETLIASAKQAFNIALKNMAQIVIGSVKFIFIGL